MWLKVGRFAHLKGTNYEKRVFASVLLKLSFLFVFLCSNIIFLLDINLRLYIFAFFSSFLLICVFVYFGVAENPALLVKLQSFGSKQGVSP